LATRITVIGRGTAEAILRAAVSERQPWHVIAPPQEPSVLTVCSPEDAVAVEVAELVVPLPPLPLVVPVAVAEVVLEETAAIVPPAKSVDTTPV
jgi:hypothetical protein